MSSATATSETLDKHKLTLATVAAIVMVIIGAAVTWATHAQAQSSRDTRVDMQLEHHGRRLDSLEAKSDYAYDALRRLEYRMGTLPPSVPLPPRE